MLNLLSANFFDLDKYQQLTFNICKDTDSTVLLQNCCFLFTLLQTYELDQFKSISDSRLKVAIVMFSVYNRK